MKKIFFALIMASSAFLCAQSFEQTSSLDSLDRLQQNNQGSSELNIKNLESSRSKKDCRCEGKRDKKEKKCPPAPPKEMKIYGSFFTTDDATVDPGAPIVFNQASIAIRGVTLNPGGIILLTRPGDYLVRFGASADGEDSSNPHVALALNGVFPQPGSNFTLNNITGTALGLTGASTIIHVPPSSIPATLTLVNADDTLDFTLNPLTEGDVSAFLTIERLNNLRESWDNNEDLDN